MRPEPSLVRQGSASTTNQKVPSIDAVGLRTRFQLSEFVSAGPAAKRQSCDQNAFGRSRMLVERTVSQLVRVLIRSLGVGLCRGVFRLRECRALEENWPRYVATRWSVADGQNRVEKIYGTSTKVSFPPYATAGSMVAHARSSTQSTKGHPHQAHLRASRRVTLHADLG